MLLYSLPGTPVIYYGDEIGMGDNFHLGDRNGVRTPMQWSPDRNAGFSRANPQEVYLPVIIDPEYHYEAVNVENQDRNLSSLLWWERRVISMRKRFRAFGRGTTQFLPVENGKVIAYIRQFEKETVLVVANLSRFAQVAELDLSAFAGQALVEVPSAVTSFPPSSRGRRIFSRSARTIPTGWCCNRRMPQRMEVRIMWRRPSARQPSLDIPCWTGR